MAKNIYLVILAIAVAVLGIVTLYAYTWLGSIGDPSIASAGYIYHSGFAWTLLWGCSLVLTAFSLYLAYEIGIRWSGVLTFLFFTVFAVFLMFNDSAYSSFLTENGIESSSTLLNPFYVALMVLVVAVFLIASHMISLNLRVKIKSDTGDSNASKKEKEDEEEEIEPGDTE